MNHRSFVADINRLDVAFRSGTLREAISASRQEAIDALGGSSREAVAQPQDRGESERTGGDPGSTKIDATPGS